MNKEAFVTDLRPADHVATVELARPDNGNRLLVEEIRALGKTIHKLGSDPAIKVVVVQAAGGAFCLGRQVPAAAPGGVKSALDIRGGVTDPILDLYADVRATPVPVLAVVQGEARGFGCALVGQCDLAIAADSALFSMPEMDNNLPPTLAISAVLGKVPIKQLLHFVYTRRQIDAMEALRMGIVGEVVTREKLSVAVAALVARLADRSRPALCAVKEYANTAPHIDPVAAARLAGNLLSVVLSSAPRD